MVHQRFDADRAHRLTLQARQSKDQRESIAVNTIVAVPFRPSCKPAHSSSTNYAAGAEGLEYARQQNALGLDARSPPRRPRKRKLEESGCVLAMMLTSFVVLARTIADNSSDTVSYQEHLSHSLASNDSAVDKTARGKNDGAETMALNQIISTTGGLSPLTELEGVASLVLIFCCAMICRHKTCCSMCECGVIRWSDTVITTCVAGAAGRTFVVVFVLLVEIEEPTHFRVYRLAIALSYALNTVYCVLVPLFVTRCVCSN